MHCKHLLLFLSVSQLAAYSPQHLVITYDQLLKGRVLTPKQTTYTPPQGMGEIFKIVLTPYESDFKASAWQDAMNVLISDFHIEDSQIPAESLTDHSTLNELEVLRGSSADDVSIMRRLTAVNADVSSLTIIGQKRCAEKLSMPVPTLSELVTRRECIRVLYNNRALLDEVALLLDKMKEAEPYVIDFCGKEGLTNAEMDIAYPSPVSRLLGLDNFPFFITFGNRLTLLNLGGIVASMSAVTVGLVGGAGACSVLALRNTLTGDGMSSSSLVSTAAILVPSAAYTGLMSTILYAALKIPVDMIKHMQERVIGYATYMRTAKRLLTLMAKYPELARLMPELKQQLRKLHSKDRSSSNTFLDLNDILMEASALDEGEPTVFSSPGDILFAYKYLSDRNVRKEYASVISAVADIDIYAVLAQQMRAHAQNSNAQFCFVDFIENSDKPVLDIQNFWHPFVAVPHAVPNSITLNQGTERNMLITGPNTGGKSTNMKAMALSVLLAQTFGIAPASSMRMTPFSAIITYLNVIDDTSSGLSLFKAEVKRVNELMEAVKNLPAGRFAFVMLDEIFTGTSPDKAEDLSYKCLNRLNEFVHAIFICATHFKKLTGLEIATNGITKNYQVEAITDEHGMVTKYTYKIIPGISKVSSAQQVAEETGLAF